MLLGELFRLSILNSLFLLNYYTVLLNGQSNRLYLSRRKGVYGIGWNDYQHISFQLLFLHSHRFQRTTSTKLIEAYLLINCAIPFVLITVQLATTTCNLRYVRQTLLTITKNNSNAPSAFGLMTKLFGIVLASTLNALNIYLSYINRLCS